MMTEKNKPLDHSDTKPSQLPKFSNNIIIRFISICVIMLIIYILITWHFYGGFEWIFYPLNLLFFSNPFPSIIAIFGLVSGIDLPIRLPNQWIVFNISEAVYHHGYIKLIAGFILTSIGLYLNYLLAKVGLKDTDESEPDDMIYQPILNIKEIINNSAKTGFNHASTIIGSSILWILTIWIPYINVGATIGLLGMIPALAKNEKFSPIDIFDKKYRKNMGEYFLLVALMSIGISVGFLFLGFPGAVIAIAWSQAIFLHIDKGYTPLKAINISNDITYGEKMKMFFSFVLLILFYGIIFGIVTGVIMGLEIYSVLAFFAFVGQLLMSLIIMGYYIYIYGQISKKLST